MQTKEYQRNYYITNKKKFKEYRKKYYLEHKDWYKQYHKDNIEKRVEYSKKWHDDKFFGGLKEKILKRDNFQCQVCKTKTERLCIHHFDGDRKNNTYWNLLTLCHGCHWSMHRGYY